MGIPEQAVIGTLDKKRVKKRVYYLVQYYVDSEQDAVWGTNLSF